MFNFRIKDARVVNYLLPLFLLCLGMWFSTGTVAPYASTIGPEGVILSKPCNYLLNGDHEHFRGAYLMLSGAPRGEWIGAVALRRILYPVLAFPFFKIWGFELGGFICAVLLNLGAVFFFSEYWGQRIGGRSKQSLLWLLSTYPGIMYWIGLPYSYAIVVPVSLLAFCVLASLDNCASLKKSFLFGLVLGILSSGYDILPLFGPAAFLLCAFRGQYKKAAVFCFGAIFVYLANIVFLRQVFQLPIRDPNANIYGVILKAYLSVKDFGSWLNLIQKTPNILVSNFLDSNFLFLPLLFTFLIGLYIYAKRRLPHLAVVWTVLIAALFLWSFNNFAPPYDGWQLRGVWIARIYQQIIPALLVACVWIGHELSEKKKLFTFLISATVLLNGWVVFGPVVGSSLSSNLYYRFYQHSGPGQMKAALEKFGVRPFGFCKPEL